MLVALGKMRWIAALLVVSVLFTLCGCHSAVYELAMQILGRWDAMHPINLETPCGMKLLMLAFILAFFSYYPSTAEANTAVAGNVCDLTAMLDNDGDGTGDTPFEMHGPWVQDGNHVTATLTPTGVASAQIVGQPQVDLDLTITGQNTMAAPSPTLLAAPSTAGR